MGRRVFRWGVDVAMCTAFVSTAVCALLLSGVLPHVVAEEALSVSKAIAAIWRNSFPESIRPLRLESASGTERETRLREEFREIEVKIDDLETRLLSGLSTVQLWRELAERHQNVSQIACENATEHLKEMAVAQKREQRQKTKIRREKEKAEAANAPSSP